MLKYLQWYADKGPKPNGAKNRKHGGTIIPYTPPVFDRENYNEYTFDKEYDGTQDAGLFYPGKDTEFKNNKYSEARVAVSTFIKNNTANGNINIIKESLKTMEASDFSDYYKCSMHPVISKSVDMFGNIHISFVVNIRDAEVLRIITSSSHPLYKKIVGNISLLIKRPFNTDTLNQIFAAKAPHFSDATLIRTAQFSTKFLINNVYERAPNASIDKDVEYTDKVDEVNTYIYFNEGKLVIETRGPWARCSWTETSVMQAVYQSLNEYWRERLKESHENWLHRALVRTWCACDAVIDYNTNAPKESQLDIYLFTGRRVDCPLFHVLQTLFICEIFHNNYNEQMSPGSANNKLKGFSSILAWRILKQINKKENYKYWSETLVPLVGTHAHEMSMVYGCLLGDYDNQTNTSLSQIFSHMLYYKYGGNPVSKFMTILPDTIGTNAFLKAANLISIPEDIMTSKNLTSNRILDNVMLVRQDSGKMDGFIRILQESVHDPVTKFSIMASEIDTVDDLKKAAILGYKSIGAGGFFGDRDANGLLNNELPKKIRTNSMAVKVLRVWIKGTASQYNPVKLGDYLNTGKQKKGSTELVTCNNLDITDLSKFEVYPRLDTIQRTATFNNAKSYACSPPAVDDVNNIFQTLWAQTVVSQKGGMKHNAYVYMKKYNKTRKVYIDKFTKKKFVLMSKQRIYLSDCKGQYKYV